MKKDSLINKFLNLFRSNGRLDPFILVLFLVINIIVLVNGILHDPKIGYDAFSHLSYIQTLPNRLPTWKDSGEFFSPPLPYVLPSRFYAYCKYYSNNRAYYQRTCRFYSGKFAQGLNVLLSIGTTLLLLLIAEQIKPTNRFFKISVLMMLALLTVYYKTFSQVRGEPYIVFFITLSVFLVVELIKNPSFNFKLVIAAGISLGLLILSRQWGFFIFPAIFLLVVWLFIQDRKTGWLRARQFILISIISALVGGWFYIHLYLDYGTFSAFNQQPKYPNIEQAYTFFGQPGLKLGELFQQPVMHEFDNRSFLGILGSDTWGDYWGYFTYRSMQDESLNPASNASYLGSVNLVSILPSLLLLAGFAWGLVLSLRRSVSPTVESSALVFITLLALSTILGYLGFVYTYYLKDNTVVKPTYIIQFFIALLFLFAAFMEVIRERSQLAYNLILILLVLVFVHNLPALITQYIGIVPL